uniref:protein-serine/threonine phosphatase n=1 Tax=Petromyzon marinus TaxID=7757 RepID=S4RHN7_PETMA
SLSESFFTVKGAALFLPRGNGTTSPRASHRRSKHAGDLQQHLQAMLNILRAEDNIKLAVRLESGYPQRTRYMVVVYTNGRQDTEESIVLGMDFPSRESNTCTIGLVLPLWSDTKIHLDGDGGFSVTTVNRTHIFKPVSVQAMWSALQCLHKTCEMARINNYYPGSLFLTWVGYYESRINSEQSCVYEWNAMHDLQSMRSDSPVLFTDQPTERERTEKLLRTKLREIMMQKDLENITSKEIRTELEMLMNCNLKEYREFIDNEMIVILGQMDGASEIFDHVYLGSEWNASNLEELQSRGVGYILNVTREIDNFFPGLFVYHNIRVYDEEATDLLAYWNDTYKFISKAKNRKSGSKCLVHCKMGVSRSASTVIAYAMKEYGWSLDKAFNFVKEKRNVAKPNASFMRQLEEYQGILDASKQRHNKLWRSHSDSNLSERLMKPAGGLQGSKHHMAMYTYPKPSILTHNSMQAGGTGALGHRCPEELSPSHEVQTTRSRSFTKESTFYPFELGDTGMTGITRAGDGNNRSCLDEPQLFCLSSTSSCAAAAAMAWPTGGGLAVWPKSPDEEQEDAVAGHQHSQPEPSPPPIGGGPTEFTNETGDHATTVDAEVPLPESPPQACLTTSTEDKIDFFSAMEKFKVINEELSQENKGRERLMSRSEEPGPAIRSTGTRLSVSDGTSASTDKRNSQEVDVHNTQDDAAPNTSNSSIAQELVKILNQAEVPPVSVKEIVTGMESSSAGWSQGSAAEVAVSSPMLVASCPREDGTVPKGAVPNLPEMVRPITVPSLGHCRKGSLGHDSTTSFGFAQCSTGASDISQIAEGRSTQSRSDAPHLHTDRTMMHGTVRRATKELEERFKEHEPTASSPIVGASLSRKNSQNDGKIGRDLVWKSRKGEEQSVMLQKAQEVCPSKLKGAEPFKSHDPVYAKLSEVSPLVSNVEHCEVIIPEEVVVDSRHCDDTSDVAAPPAVERADAQPPQRTIEIIEYTPAVFNPAMKHGKGSNESSTVDSESDNKASMEVVFEENPDGSTSLLLPSRRPSKLYHQESLVFLEEKGLVKKHTKELNEKLSSPSSSVRAAPVGDEAASSTGFARSTPFCLLSLSVAVRDAPTCEHPTAFIVHGVTHTSTDTDTEIDSKIESEKAAECRNVTETDVENKHGISVKPLGTSETLVHDKKSSSTPRPNLQLFSPTPYIGSSIDSLQIGVNDTLSSGRVRQQAKEIESKNRQAGLTTPSRMKRSHSLAKLGSFGLCQEDTNDEASLDPVEPMELKRVLSTERSGQREPSQGERSSVIICSTKPIDILAHDDGNRSQLPVLQTQRVESSAGDDAHGSQSIVTAATQDAGSSVQRQQHGRTHPLRRLKKTSEKKRTTNPLYNTV